MGLYGGGTNHMEEEEDTHQCLLSTVGGLWGKGKEREEEEEEEKENEGDEMSMPRRGEAEEKREDDPPHL